MNRRTKALQFSPKTKLKIANRDPDCVFCMLGYATPGADPIEVYIKDTMHVVNKSQGGLGVEQNGAKGCRYHHHIFDNGNQGLREQMREDLENYMKELYPGWTRESVTYKKYNF